MHTLHSSSENPLVQGIKIIGIGKHGSKPLSPPLLEEILAYLSEKNTISIQKGAFFGALMAKGPTEDEKRLLQQICGESGNLNALYDHLCVDSPGYMKPIGVKLLGRETLPVEEAETLGRYLFSDEPGETFRGMAVSMLRIRYETDEEYAGFYKAVLSTFSRDFQKTPSNLGATIQLAEPFDGVEHSYLLTPLLAHAFGQKGYPVVVTAGRSSGPKLTLNALDIYQALGGTFIDTIQSLTQRPPAFGWVIDQGTLSPALDLWVDRRKLIFKRPFLATLEKVLNPCGAKILITSVFHITYMEKMISLAAMAGFSAVIVLKRGLEGTLAPSIAKASGILCAVIQPDGSFLTQTFDATDEAYAAYRAESDEVVEDISVAENIRLIHGFTEKGFTGNIDFDKRVNLAIALYTKGIEWLEQHIA
ncbi:anthranilate phosphoribosyltransferase [Rhodocytophaga aerolata]|uniref:Anthranilate phosphoribosyltransferase n=1 Tax=Rhodocytophaga aerolata TaxID=455078 RepID=A0ABT8R5U4_9BACT|nr:anthranilate phosphoribosyltransferase [Rhodocytophaga aerolata]MDO1446754.1 anthranilate phosphoribosyltransferase [Rhodocytophaga aerolata]